jgi:hypothetical protein
MNNNLMIFMSTLALSIWWYYFYCIHNSILNIKYFVSYKLIIWYVIIKHIIIKIINKFLIPGYLFYFIFMADFFFQLILLVLSIICIKQS